MTVLEDLAARVKKEIPSAEIEILEPALKNGPGYADITLNNRHMIVEWWQEKGIFGITDSVNAGYGVSKPDESYHTLEETAKRLIEIFQ